MSEAHRSAREQQHVIGRARAAVGKRDAAWRPRRERRIVVWQESGAGQRDDAQDVTGWTSPGSASPFVFLSRQIATPESSRPVSLSSPLSSSDRMASYPSLQNNQNVTVPNHWRADVICPVPCLSKTSQPASGDTHVQRRRRPLPSASNGTRARRSINSPTGTSSRSGTTIGVTGRRTAASCRT